MAHLKYLHMWYSNYVFFGLVYLKPAWKYNNMLIFYIINLHKSYKINTYLQYNVHNY